jgi:hypothetical protein
MDPSGLIYGSALENPYVWPSFNFIGADYESDKGVCLAKYRNYVVAFGEFTTQLFYNSGVGPNLLRPVQNANVRVGCQSAASVTAVDGTLYWLGRDERTRGIGVYRFEGLSPVKVSDPFIDRFFLDITTTDVVGSNVKTGGHTFVFMTIIGGATLVFDATTGLWYIWESFAGGRWTANRFATDGVFDYCLNDSNAIVYVMSPATFTDNGTTITVQGRTNLQDGGISLWKFCRRAAVIGDRVANSTVTLEFTDDDYQSYTSMGAVAMDQSVASSNRGGRFRRRGWRWTHATNTTFRAEAIEAMIDVGNS